MGLEPTKANEFKVESQNSTQTIVVNPFFYEISLQDMVHLTINLLKREYLLCVLVSGQNFLIQPQSEFRSEIESDGKYIDYHVIKYIYYTRIDAPSYFLVVNDEQKCELRNSRNSADMVHRVISIDFFPDNRLEAIKEMLKEHLASKIS
jgi:hypothetical protein